ncbi:hypothetical protein HanIR_Chr05g0247951 [Helianthus annuus]|nr:hypothetical protein HanIR_Chr05g0247951 [Helianthus annuus]
MECWGQKGKRKKQRSFLLVCRVTKACYKAQHLVASNQLTRPKMLDWAPILVGLLLFILLSPGLIFQLPGNTRTIEFGNFHTNGRAIIVHTFLFFGAFTILILATGIHIFTGRS